MPDQKMNNPVLVKAVVVADRYLESARILLKPSNKQTLPSFVLAALAVEIYLKSLLLKSEKKLICKMDLPDDEGSVYSYEYIISNRIWKHKYSELYQILKESNYHTLLLNTLGISEEDLTKQFNEFENYFTGLRYHYEDKALQSANSGILELAESLKNACYKIMEANQN